MDNYNECLKYLDDKHIKYVIDDTCISVLESCQKHKECDIVFVTSPTVLKTIKHHTKNIVCLFCVVKKYETMTYIFHNDNELNVPCVLSNILNGTLSKTCNTCLEENKTDEITCWNCCAYLCSKCMLETINSSNHPYCFPHHELKCPMCKHISFDYIIHGTQWKPNMYLETNITKSPIEQFIEILYNLDGCITLLFSYRKEIHKMQVCLNTDTNECLPKMNILNVEPLLDTLFQKHKIIDIAILRNTRQYNKEHNSFVNEVSYLRIDHATLISYPIDSYSVKQLRHDEYHMSISYIEPTILSLPRYFDKWLSQYNIKYPCDKLVCIHDEKEHHESKYIFNQHNFLSSEKNMFIQNFDFMTDHSKVLWITFGNYNHNNSINIDVEIFIINNKQIKKDTCFNKKTRKQFIDIFNWYCEDNNFDKVIIKRFL